MTAQMMQNKSVVAVFSSRREADQAKQAIQQSGIAAQRVFIDDHISPSIQVAAQGTTTGGQAGLLMGTFFGGIIGLIAVIIISYQTTGDYPHSAFSRLAILGSSILGAVLGASSGRALWAGQPADQKKKADPNLPRQFRLVIEGSQDEIRQAQQALGQPPVTA